MRDRENTFIAIGSQLLKIVKIRFKYLSTYEVIVGDHVRYEKAGKVVNLIILLLSIGVVSAQSTQSLSSALDFLCTVFYDLLPMGVLVLVTLAGLIFAVGQTMGAETRARANVWATNMLIGALIAGAVIIIVPSVVNILVPGADLSNCN